MTTSKRRPPSRHVFLRVVDDVVGAERARLLDVPRAAHRRHLGAERLRDLDGKRADAAGGAVNEHVLSGLHLPVVAEPLQRRERRDRHGGRLLEREVRRLGRYPPVHRANDLGKRAGVRAEDLVTGPEALDVLADGLDDPREVVSDQARLRPPKAGHDARRRRCPGQAVPVELVQRGGANAHEDPVVRQLRHLDLLELERVGAVPLGDGRPHRRLPLCGHRRLERFRRHRDTPLVGRRRSLPGTRGSERTSM